MVGVAGLSIINRYLLVPSLMIMVYGAVAVGGWTMLRRGACAVHRGPPSRSLAVVGGGIYTAAHLRRHVFSENLSFRGDSHRALVQAARRPEGPRRAAGAARCRCPTTS